MAQRGNQLFDLLKKDHHQVEQMMKQIQSAPDDQRKEIFSELSEVLREHLQMEEKHLYPQLKKITEMKELVQDALREHQEAKQHLDDLEEMEVDSDDWQDTFQEMQEGVHHHLQDEEHKVFPKCSQTMDERQLTDIAEKCAREKEKAHPARTAPGTKAKRHTRKQPQL